MRNRWAESEIITGGRCKQMRRLLDVWRVLIALKRATIKEVQEQLRGDVGVKVCLRTVRRDLLLLEVVGLAARVGNSERLHYRGGIRIAPDTFEPLASIVEHVTVGYEGVSHESC